MLKRNLHTNFFVDSDKWNFLSIYDLTVYLQKSWINSEKVWAQTKDGHSQISHIFSNISRFSLLKQTIKDIKAVMTA